MPDLDKIQYLKNNTNLVCKMYVDGYSSREIEKHTQISQRSVLRILKKNKIQSRTISDASTIYHCDENIFEYIDSHEKAYWVGFLAADGCITGGNLKLVLSSKDRCHIENFRTFLKSDHNINSCTIKMSKNSAVKNKEKLYYSCSINIRNKKIIKDLEKYSIVPNKTYSLKFGKNIPDQFINSYMAGLIDGDGCVCISNKKISIGLVSNKNCVSLFQEKLISKLLLRKNKLRFRKDCPSVAVLTYSGKKVFEIGRFFYKDTPVCLKRKKDKILDFFKQNSF